MTTPTQNPADLLAASVARHVASRRAALAAADEIAAQRAADLEAGNPQQPATPPTRGA